MEKVVFSMQYTMNLMRPMTKNMLQNSLLRTLLYSSRMEYLGHLLISSKSVPHLV